MINNKRGFSLTGWTEVALMVTLFALLFIALIANMNVDYNKNIDGTMGLTGLASTTQNNISDYQSTLQQSVASGQATSSGLGVSLTTTWSIISSGCSIMWSFLTGGWIEQLVGLAKLPTIVGTFLRIIFVLSIGFIVLKLVLKLKP
jgi:hypothetical protein